MRSIAIRIGIIAAIAIAYFIARPFISSSADTLQVGDCFDNAGPDHVVVGELFEDRHRLLEGLRAARQWPARHGFVQGLNAHCLNIMRKKARLRGRFLEAR